MKRDKHETSSRIADGRWHRKLPLLLLTMLGMSGMVARGEWVATGGTVTNYTLAGTNYTAHIFLASGTFFVNSNLSCDVLLVGGGGGGGGRYMGGGGGAGGLISSNNMIFTHGAYPVSVGSGGSGGSGQGVRGLNGGDSIVGSLAAAGGGGGGSWNTVSAGLSGGSGGGSSGYGTAYGTASPAGQGNNGGAGATYGAGGGGGADAPGGKGTTQNGGAGGDGITSSLTGVAVVYAGGGGGAAYQGMAGNGGLGGGGAGAQYNGAPIAGTSCTGGGGGGANGYNNIDLAGAAGGSGIVIVRYPQVPVSLTAPVITNLGATAHYTTASLQGQVLDLGGDIPQVWFYYWQDGGATTSTVAMGQQYETFSVQVDGLPKGSLYHFQILAVNSAGSVWSDPKSFTTQSGFATYYVTPAGTGSGSSWTDALNDVQMALDAAVSNETIYLAGQTFSLADQLVWTNSFVTIRGGYAATNAAEQPGPCDPAVWPTVLERSGAANHRILFVENLTAGELQGVTLRNGYLFGIVNGGGLYVNNSSGLLVDRCIVEENVLDHGGNQDAKGAGMHLNNSRAVITNCHIRNNEIIGGGDSWNGSGRGAGVYVKGGSVTLASSALSGNRAYSSGRQGGFGGGVYLDGPGAQPHRISHCRLFGNSVDGIHNVSKFPNAGCPGNGGALYMTGTDVAVVENCVISNNYAFVQGGGVTMAGGTLRNSLICDNVTAGWDLEQRVYGGGGVQVLGAGCRLVNVTVVDNTSLAPTSVAGINLTAGALSNSIVYHNTQTYLYDNVRRNLPESGGTVAHSIAWPEPTGTGNTAAEPEWMDRQAHNYRLRPGSPALDAGVNQDWMTPAVDVEAEHLRQVGANVDIGAYEADFDDYRLIANFTADETQGIDALNVTFTAHVAGTATNGLTYRWDFDNDGVFDLEGTDKRIVSHLYGPATFCGVRLQVENATSDVEEVVKNDFIRVESSAIHVSLTGDGSTGLNWSSAYTNLPDALAHATHDNTILVAGGEYRATAEIAWAGHSNVTIRGGYEGTGASTANDPTQWPTTLKAVGQHRVLLLENVQDCTLEGVTLANGNAYSGVADMWGGGMYILNSSAAIANCLLTNNQARAAGNSYAWGGGIYAETSEIALSRTRFSHNVAKNDSSSNNGRTLGGGLAAQKTKVTVLNCEFLQNDSDGVGHHGSWGGGMHLVDGTGWVRNTLFAGNRARPRAGTRGYIGRGGAVYLTDGTLLENVTVVGNQVRNSGANGYTTTAGGIFAAGGAISNSIVYYNTEAEAGVPADVFAEAPAVIATTCASDVTSGVNGNITSTPEFVDKDSGNFRLSKTSPCVDAGVKAPWMIGATDLDGNKRILNGREDRPYLVDFGAYEVVPPAATLFWLR